MILQFIKIKNFRGIRNGQFDFSESPVILLTAQNGLGKTTLLDAIEWALTGNIYRLKYAFDRRSTNSSERQKNISGIIRNKDSSDSEQISVELTFSEKGKVFTILRSQQNDELDPKKVKQDLEVIQGNPTQCSQILGKIDCNNFYQYHFCDIQKSMNIQSCKRDRLADLFSEFISDYSSESNCAENLTRFIADIDQKLETINGRISSLKEKEEQHTATIEKLSSHSKIIPYPPQQIFAGEITDHLSSLSEVQLQQQLSHLKSCAHHQLTDLLHPLVIDRKRQCLLEKGKDLQTLLISKKNDIAEVLELNGTGNLDDFIQSTSTELKRCREMKVTRSSLTRYADLIIGFGCSDFSQDFYLQHQVEISDAKKCETELSAEIASLTNGNELLNTLTNLLGLEEDLLAYRATMSAQNNVVKCPVCGSERFDQLDASEILGEVKRQTNASDMLVSKKKHQLEEIKNHIEQSYLTLIAKAQQALQDHITSQEKHQQHLEILAQHTADYFKLKHELTILYPDISASVWDDTSQISKLLQHTESELLSEVATDQIHANFISFYRAIYEKEPEITNIETTYNTEYALGSDAPEMLSDFQPGCFLVKKEAIESLLNNQEFTETTKLLDINRSELQKLEVETRTLKRLKNRASIHVEHIRDLTAQLKQDEYQSIGPYLRRLYKKLARVDSIEEIKLKNDDDGSKLSLLDEKGMNIVNILSNGQLSVFMLSYFFAGILSRNPTEPCKIYFIDDLTACMDDVNMLAFLDLLKYQMLSDNHPIEQLFFASCDERVCELLKYKLDGCRISYTELSSLDFLQHQ